jgi:hypothetical protein
MSNASTYEVGSVQKKTLPPPPLMLAQYVSHAVPLPDATPPKDAASTHACWGVALPVGLVG